MMDIALLQVKNHVKIILCAFGIGAVVKAILNMVLIPQFSIFGASVSTVISLFIFVWILQYQVLKLYHFQTMKKFIVKLVITMMLLSITVQIVMFLIPGEGRMQGLVELAVAATIGVIVVIFLSYACIY